jgi:hypothetical protein
MSTMKMYPSLYDVAYINLLSMHSLKTHPLKETLDVNNMLKPYYKSVIKLSFTLSQVSCECAIMNFPGKAFLCLHSVFFSVEKISASLTCLAAETKGVQASQRFERL